MLSPFVCSQCKRAILLFLGRCRTASEALRLCFFLYLRLDVLCCRLNIGLDLFNRVFGIGFYLFRRA